MAKKKSMNGCVCGTKSQHVAAETILASGMIHTQFNCLACGAGWATDERPTPEGPTLATEPLNIEGDV